MSATGYITEVNANLTVVNFSQPSTPLSSNTNRLFPGFRKARRIKDENSIRFPQRGGYLTSQLITQGPVLPLRFTDKVLNGLSIEFEEIGDGFGVLIFQIRAQPTHDILRVRLLIIPPKTQQKRTHECLYAATNRFE